MIKRDSIKYLKIFIIALLPVWFGANNLMSQTFVIEKLGLEEGLSHEVQWGYRVILEDQFGFIWIATMNGLNRYDGYEMHQYLSDVPIERMKIPFQGISALTEDKLGNIWIGGQYAGVGIYDVKEEKFESFNAAAEQLGEAPFSQINALFQHEDYMYISAPWQGIYRYHLYEEKIEKLILRTEEDKNRDDYDSDRSLLNGHIYDFLTTANGELAAINYQGVFVLNDLGTRHYAIEESFSTRNFAEIEDNKILVNSYKEIASVVIDLNSDTVEKFDEIEEPAMHHFVDNENRIWTNYYDGKLVANALSKKNKIIKEDGITNFNIDEENYILDMIQSRSGDYYFMSITNGAGKIERREESFKMIHRGEFINFSLINETLYFWRRDSLFIAKDNQTSIVPIDIPSKFEISSVFIDKDQNYYICGYNWFKSELFKLDSNYNLIYRHHCRFIEEFAELDNGTIIMDSEVLEENQDCRYLGRYYSDILGEEYKDAFIKDMVKLQNGDIWGATSNNGINVLDKSLDSLTFHRKEESSEGNLNSNNIKFFAETKEGYVFCHSDQGINIWDPNEEYFYSLGAADGIKVNEITGIIQDDDGLVWMLTTNKFYSYDLETKNIQSFVVPEQFKAVVNMESGYETKVLKDKEGIILFAGVNGIVGFDPHLLKKKIKPRPVLITDLFINRTRIYPGDQTGILDSSILFQKQFELDFKNRNPGFSFISIEGDELDSEYSYRLTGLQDDWISLGKERTINFTNLDPGDYQFDVRVKSGAGKSVEKFSSLKFTVNPPWYRTFAAYIIYALIGIGLFVAYLQMRIRKAVAQIQITENIRTKISADLHDDVGTILAGVAMQAELLAINPDNESKEELDDLSRDTRNAMEKMRDIVWALDSHKDKFENLFDKMKYFAETNFQNSNFTYQFTIKELPGGQKINPDVRQNLYLIFKEAVINIKKHSNGNRVIFEIAQSKMDLKFSIKDNGTYNSINKSEGAGLKNMKMRAEKIGAQFKIDNTDGFEIIIILKKS